MMLFVALNTWPENAAPERDFRELAMPERIDARPYCTSRGDLAYTNEPRLFTVACHRSSMATAPGLLIGIGGLFGVAVVSGHFDVPAMMLLSARCWFDASIVPDAPNEIAENCTCGQ